MRPAATPIAATFSTAVLLSTAARAAEPADVTLRWTAPASCPDEAHVRAAVEAVAGHPLHAPGAPRVTVAIEAAPSGEGAWAVRIAVAHPGDAAPRERRIEGASCAEVADAAAVAVALALAAEAAPPEPPRRPPVLVPAVATPPADDPHELPPEPEAPPLHPGLRVLAGADFASLPGPAFGVEVAGLLGFGANRVELRGAAWLPKTAEATAMADARIALYVAGVRYCRFVLQGTVDIGGCAGIEAGALVGSSQGVTHPGSGTSPWLAPELGALGAWEFSRYVALSLGLSGLVPVVREHFEIAGLGDVYQPPPLTFRALVGLEVRFR
jgi:hypothetical protein